MRVDMKYGGEAKLDPPELETSVKYSFWLKGRY
jgi:hypothetical protein